MPTNQKNDICMCLNWINITVLILSLFLSYVCTIVIECVFGSVLRSISDVAQEKACGCSVQALGQEDRHCVIGAYSIIIKPHSKDLQKDTDISSATPTTYVIARWKWKYCWICNLMIFNAGDLDMTKCLKLLFGDNLFLGLRGLCNAPLCLKCQWRIPGFLMLPV